MIPEPSPLDAAQLLRHGSFLRSLARSLVGDGVEAEDLEQEVWLAALGHPAGRAANPRAWLAAVMRNARHKAIRARARREAREETAARDEALPSGEELVARMEISRTLCEAVLALPEPLRSTIHLHYAEGLPAREIARLGGTPMETVRSRIARGLALLRERLDGELEGGRGAWCAALAPLVSFPSLGPWKTGVAIMSSSRILAAGALAALLIIGGVWTWRGASADREPERIEEPAALPPTSSREAIALPTLPAPPDRAASTDGEEREPGRSRASVSGDSPANDGDPTMEHLRELEALGYTASTENPTTGHLTGRVTVGRKPSSKKARPIEELFEFLDYDPKAAGESLRIDETGGLADAVVLVRAKETDRRKAPTPRTVEIRNGRFEPHVVAVPKGGRLQFVNRDGGYVVVQSEPERNLPFTLPIAAGSTSRAVELTREETFEVTDDLESGMSLQVVVTDGPFTAVTDEKGAFEVADLPPGRHRIELRHARLGELKVKAEARIVVGEAVELPIEVDEKQVKRALKKTPKRR